MKSWIRIHNTELHFRHFANIKKPVKISDDFSDTFALVAGRDTSTEIRQVSLGHRKEQFHARLLDPDLRGSTLMLICGSRSMAQKWKKNSFLRVKKSQKVLTCLKLQEI
jgi:hypothetical protein